MSVPVIGGAGFIGSNLVYDLIKEHGVTVLDNLHNSSADNLKDVKDEITVIVDSGGNISNPVENCIAHTLADLAKVDVALGFRSEYSLEEGIREVV